MANLQHTILFGVTIIATFLWLLGLRTHLAYWRLRFGPGANWPVPREEIPADVRLILDQSAPSLAALGFVYSGSRLIQPHRRTGDSSPRFADHYFHPEAHTRARVTPDEMPEPGSLVVVTFMTPCADGMNLTTVNQVLPRALPMPPQTLAADGLFPDLAAQWELHLSRLAAHPAEPVPDLEEMARRSQAAEGGLLGYWQREGLIKPAGDELFRLTLRGVRRMRAAVREGNRRLAKLPRTAVSEGDEALLAADLLAANSLDWREVGSEWTHRLLLWGVAAAGIFLALDNFASPLTTHSLLIVILINELGHLLGMRLSGYRSRSMVSLMVLGVGQAPADAGISILARILTHLAGPITLLLVAMAALYALPEGDETPSLLMGVGVGALGFGLFQLLPLLPLAGGRVFELLFVRRWPKLGYLPFFAGALAIMLLSKILVLSILVGLGALLVLIGLVGLGRIPLLIRIGHPPPDSAPRAILEALRKSPDLAKLRFMERQLWVRQLLPTVAAPLPRVPEILLGLAIYLTMILLPLANLPPAMPLESIADAITRPKRIATPPDWEAQLSKAKTGDERWRILIDAGRWLERGENRRGARRRYEQAQVIAQGFLPDDPRRRETRLALARSAEPAQVLPAYLELLPEFRALPKERRHELAQLLEEIVRVDDESPIRERIERLYEVIAIYEEIGCGTGMVVRKDRKRIARIYYLDGDAVSAEIELRLNLEPHAALNDVIPLAWLLIDTGRPAAAEALVRTQLRDDAIQRNWYPQEPLSWSKQAQGKGREAALELAEALAALPEKHHVKRAELLLDLAFLAEEPAEQAKWREQAREEIGETRMGSAVFRQMLFDGMKHNPWQRIPYQARIATLDGLGPIAPPASGAAHLPVWMD